MSHLIWIYTVCTGILAWSAELKRLSGSRQAENVFKHMQNAQIQNVQCIIRAFARSSRVYYSFVEIDHEIFSVVILSLPLIQEGQLSVSGKRMCTILVNRLED